MEQVTTPAGSFKGYKLIRSERWSVGSRLGEGSSTTTYFYSPETRSIVKRSGLNDNNPGTIETELIKFTQGIKQLFEVSKLSTLRTLERLAARLRRPFVSNGLFQKAVLC